MSVASYRLSAVTPVVESGRLRDDVFRLNDRCIR